jgi:hypothetical protein
MVTHSEEELDKLLASYRIDTLAPQAIEDMVSHAMHHAATPQQRLFITHNMRRVAMCVACAFSGYVAGSTFDSPTFNITSAATTPSSQTSLDSFVIGAQSLQEVQL